MDDGVAGDFEQGLVPKLPSVGLGSLSSDPITHLRHIEGQWAEPSTSRGASDLIHLLVLGGRGRDH